jgi:predicted ATPase
LADGLEAVEQALAIVEVTSERWWESEAHRIRAKLLAAADKRGQEEAESSYLRGLDIARAQGAHFLELRTAKSLACLWRDRGKHQEAHDMLAAVYDGHIEGFDTPDLKEAKVLLDELA